MMDEIDKNLWKFLGGWLILVLRELDHRNWSISDERMEVSSERFKIVLTRKGEVIYNPALHDDGKAE